MVLSVLSIWSSKSNATASKSSRASQKHADEPVQVSVEPVAEEEVNSKPVVSEDTPGSSTPINVQESVESLAVPMTQPPPPEHASTAPQTEANDEHVKPEAKDKPTSIPPPRFSFRSFGFLNGSSLKPEITKEQDANERQKAQTAAKRDSLSLSLFSRSGDRRTTRNALAVQRLIVGPNNITVAAPGGANASTAKARAHAVSRSEMTRIKSELIKPNSANRLIAKLRELPAPTPVVEASTETGADKAKEKSKAAAAPAASQKVGGRLPIHAVCLESPEADVQAELFSKLHDQSVISSSLDALSSLFSELHVVDLLSAPDLGFGQPGCGKGLLAGAVPTAETVLDGAAKLTPQLMALGYATGQSILPDHSILHPPTDRLSVLTYWWGLELCLPPPTLAHLSQAPNIAHQVINFLSALSLMYNGVREVLPFVRYIGQFVDFEWSAIKKADKGKGVVCAATWIMPAAMVPRSWDFPDPPLQPAVPVAPGTGTSPVVPPIVPVNGQLPSVIVTPPSVIKTPTTKEVATAAAV